ncbi:MAG TPA: LamG domain-containing protein [Terriglobia bacterium]|nr:LamG domain-containing protein [Terriglobia bacterium]
MNGDIRWRYTPLVMILALAFASGAFPQTPGLVAKWSFNSSSSAVTRESVGGAECKVEGYYKYISGVEGDGLRFDGYTTSVTLNAKNAPKLTTAFTIDAWVALNTYPWNWVPVVDHEEDQQAGYAFGIDAFGHVGLKVAVAGAWETLTSTEQLPLKKWAHIAGTYDASQGLTIYIDGKPAGHLPVQGQMTTADRVDILIGRVRRAMLPVPSGLIHPKYAVWYSLDGILDEIEIYDHSLSAESLAQTYASVQAPEGEVLPWPKMPSGPPGAGRFGAYYATLKFQDTWDRPRRIGPQSDVVVRFDEAPIRLVFWQGTNYIPAWVTENDKWYTDEFLETGGSGCPDGGDCEPMSDKQSRYSHVSIIENNNARVVVHWRYALNEVEHYIGAWPDPFTGWFDWADEYWTVYPDGVAVRKQVIRSSALDKGHEFQETIVINQPGTRPEDNINLDALTLENMQGQTATYTWQAKAPKVFDYPHGPKNADKPQGANIQLVNLKSEWKPFQIVSPDHSSFGIYGGEKTYFTFECWNHWPVAQIASSGRPCVAADRASHTSLSHIHWKVYSRTPESMTKILLDGLTSQGAANLLPLAKSWISPPQMTVTGEGYTSKGYDPAQRAFVIARQPGSQPAALEINFQASENSPLYDPAIVVKNWGTEAARLKVNGKTVNWGKENRMGHIHRLDGADLVVWMRKESNSPVTMTLSAESH